MVQSHDEGARGRAVQRARRRGDDVRGGLLVESFSRANHGDRDLHGVIDVHRGPRRSSHSHCAQVAQSRSCPIILDHFDDGDRCRWLFQFPRTGDHLRSPPCVTAVQAPLAITWFLFGIAEQFPAATALADLRQ